MVLYLNFTKCINIWVIPNHNTHQITSHCCTKQNRISLQGTPQCSISHHQLNTISHQTLHTSAAERYTFLTKVYHAANEIYALTYQSAVPQEQCVKQHRLAAGIYTLVFSPVTVYFKVYHNTSSGWQLEAKSTKSWFLATVTLPPSSCRLVRTSWSLKCAATFYCFGFLLLCYKYLLTSLNCSAIFP